MRAIQVTRYGGPEVLEPVELERPSPISTEVLVKVHAAGVNPVDWKTRRGTGVSHWVGPPPFVPGWDVAGVVEATGYGVTRIAPGDHVYGMPWFPRAASAYAEYVTAPSRHFARMPEGIGFEEAGAMPLAALTATQALDSAAVEEGTRVLVLAASGGVGHLTVQLAKLRDAHVTAAGSPRNLDFLRELGADEVVDRTTIPVERFASDIDAVIDLVGGDVTGAALATLREDGVLVAVPDGADDATKLEAERRAVSVIEPLVEPDGRILDEIAAFVAGGRLRVVIDRVFALEEAAAAHEHLETGSVRGKVVLRV
ncbi:MAG TPA: NADP-dependent oxidoreductase [Thermoleophilaceae bacterium]